MTRVKFKKPGPAWGLAYHIGEEADIDNELAQKLIAERCVDIIETASIDENHVEKRVRKSKR